MLHESDLLHKNDLACKKLYLANYDNYNSVVYKCFKHMAQFNVRHCICPDKKYCEFCFDNILLQPKSLIYNLSFSSKHHPCKAIFLFMGVLLVLASIMVFWYYSFIELSRIYHARNHENNYQQNVFNQTATAASERTNSTCV